jgi:thiol-disulfide isomerase/thioredoxin
MRSRVRLVLLVVVVAVTIVGVVVARRTGSSDVLRAIGAPAATVANEGDVPVLDPGPAPSLDAASGWLNSRPLKVGDLAGKVVLYEFWTFGCINCQHTLSHVKAWNARYAADGLVVVAIHSPEFAYEADPKNVQHYIDQEQITYPVALDPDMRVWHAWNTRAWPSFWVYDRLGRARLQHIGEGGYEQTEATIRLLLGVSPSSPKASV